MQAKSKDDLREVMRVLVAQLNAQNQLIAAGMGVNLPQLEVSSPEPAAAPVASDPAPVAEPARAVVEPDGERPAAAMTEPGKAVKEDMLRQLIREELQAVLSGERPAAATAPVQEQPASTFLQATEIRPTVDEVTAALMGAASAPPAAPGPKSWRKVVDPAAGASSQSKAEPEMVFSTMAGGYIPKADRDACWAPLRPGRQDQRPEVK